MYWLYLKLNKTQYSCITIQKCEKKLPIKTDQKQISWLNTRQTNFNNFRRGPSPASRPFLQIYLLWTNLFVVVRCHMKQNNTVNFLSTESIQRNERHDTYFVRRTTISKFVHSYLVQSVSMFWKVLLEAIQSEVLT